MPLLHRSTGFQKFFCRYNTLSLSLWGPLSADKTAVVWFLSRGYGSLYLEFS